MDFEKLKEQLEKEAFREYEEHIDKTEIDRPDDSDLFKDNEETAKICQQVIEHDEQVKKVLEAQKSNAYTVKEEPSKKYRNNKTHKAEVVEAEPVKSGWGSGFYGSSRSSSSSGSSSNSYSYGGYSGYNKTTPKTKEEIEREEYEKLKNEIDEVFKIAVEDAFDTSGVENKNIFELEQAEQRKRRIRTQQAENNGEYTEEQKKLKKKLRKMVYFVRAYSAIKVTLKAALGKELKN